MGYWYYDFPKAAPRPKAKPGKARKKFGETWWGKKWVEILSEFEYDQRMSRGRAYARADRVKNFIISEGKISATVKGSSGNYKVNISFRKYGGKDWNNIMQRLNDTPIVLSKLLNNEMPENIKEITSYSFIPKSFDGDCSCPDYANPCKHMAAVFYTVADEVDYDPLILFKLNGMDKNKMLSALGMVDEADVIKKAKIQKQKPKKIAGNKSKTRKNKKKKNG